MSDHLTEQDESSQLSSGRTVLLPYLDLSDQDFGAVTMLSEASRWKLLEQLLAGYSYSCDDVPTAWAESPLRAWCWLVLVTNGVDHDDQDPRDLVHYGIDLGFSSSAVRTWVWALA